MKTIVNAGIGIGVLCSIWMFIMGFTGWYKDPTLTGVFYVVILIQIGVLICGLRSTAVQGKTYWPQVGAGTLMSVVGAVIIFFGSLFFTIVVFPQYFEEMRTMYTEMWRAGGKSQAEIENLLSMMAASQTPLIQAAIGAVATVVTGLVASLVIAAFARKK